MKPLYIDGLSASSYHAAPGLSSSMIRLIPDKPLRFRNRYLCRRPGCLKLIDECQCGAGPLFDPHKETPAMALGTAVHRVLLDGANIEVIPAKYLTKTGQRPSGEKTKLPLEEWEADNRGTVNVLHEDSPVHRMVESVRTHPIAGPMIADAEAIKERSIWWEDQWTGLLRKARIDLWIRGHLLDLKTSKAPRPGQRDFAAEIAYYELHRQLACYYAGAEQVGMGTETGGFIAVGNSAESDYECWVHGLRDEAFGLGYTQNIAAMREIKARLASGNWSPEGYAVEHETGPSEWYMKKHE